MNLRYMRERAGLSQKELSVKMQVGQSAVSMWETGESSPSHKNLINLAKVLNCTVDELLQDRKQAAGE